ncbi:MAG: hypothetical protein ACFE7R_03310 [Candidatus Hodarchaeota archaeon]
MNFDVYQYPPFLDGAKAVLELMLALIIRGYLVFVLIGFMIYVTGVSDGLGKAFVALGVIIYIGGPFLLELFGGVLGLELPTLEAATSRWLRTIGMTDSELVGILVLLGDMVAAIAILAGAILYFTPSPNDLKERGYSLIVRALMFTPVLVFFHIAPWI